jgi:hypothetical protein
MTVCKDIKRVVTLFSQHLQFRTLLKTKGRKVAIAIEDVITLALFKHCNGIPTKRQVYNLFRFKLKCSYKTFVVSLIRWAPLAALAIVLIMKLNRANQHLVKHVDSTTLPVCLFKNAKHHKTMKSLAAFGHSSQGTFFGLKLHLISDFKRQVLNIRFTAGNIDDREVVLPMSKEIWGILIGDAGYVSDKLARKFYQEGKRIFIAKPRKNMKKLMTKFEQILYDSRAIIELNFRNLKMFHGLLTSLPRSVNGYLANYLYSILTYVIA